MIVALLAVLCTALFAWGHDIRDGHPALGTTHGARALGAALCGLGGLAVFGLHLAALAAWLGIWCGFYTDSKHGEGQANVGFKHDAPYLLLSGLTSLSDVAMMFALLAIFAAGPAWSPAIVLVGFAKVGIWPAAWAIIPESPANPFAPTRVAAIAFGAVIGAAIAGIGLLS